MWDTRLYFHRFQSSYQSRPTLREHGAQFFGTLSDPCIGPELFQQRYPRPFK